MKEKTKEIIEKIDKSEEIIKIKNLQDKINNNEEYKKLMKNFIDSKDVYIKNNTINEEIKKLRKELFSIEELKEFLKLQNDIRMLSISINKIILSVLD